VNYEEIVWKHKIQKRPREWWRDRAFARTKTAGTQVLERYQGRDRTKKEGGERRRALSNALLTLFSFLCSFVCSFLCIFLNRMAGFAGYFLGGAPGVFGRVAGIFHILFWSLS
jgi:hypothetical protein